MDATFAVEKEVDKFLGKFGNFKDHSSQSLDELINELALIQKEVLEFKDDIDDSLLHKIGFIIGSIKLKTAKVGTDHKELHSTVSKIGKVIDKNFLNEFSSISNDNFINDSNKEHVNKIICQHFFREGLIGTAETFLKEASFEEKNDASVQFYQISSIVQALKRHDLQPAIDWVEQNKEKLNEQKSPLEFKLHRLAYLKLLQEHPCSINDIVQYAKKHLTEFAVLHEKAIQSLLGCLLYASSGLKESPYKRYLSEDHWIDISESFMREACLLQGLSMESPLAVCVSAGCTALPVLLNIKQVMQQQRVNTMWDSKDELPVEIDLGSEMRFHSIFACPILRQQSTTNNPPMRLVCGHVISKDAVTKLTHSNKLKCPYCPIEQNVEDTTFIYF